MGRSLEITRGMDNAVARWLVPSAIRDVQKKPRDAKVRTSFSTHSTHSFSFPSRPLLLTTSSVPNMFRRASMRMTALAHSYLLVLTVVSMISQLVAGNALWYERTRWSRDRPCALRWCLAKPGGARCWSCSSALGIRSMLRYRTGELRLPPHGGTVVQL